MTLMWDNYTQTKVRTTAAILQVLLKQVKFSPGLHAPLLWMGPDA
jgi:hypothetical protein